MGRRSGGVRVGFFCHFFPEFLQAANSSTGLAYMLSQREDVSSVLVFSQMNGELPPHITGRKIKIERCWIQDDPVSLIKTIMRMVQVRHEIDAYFFNMFVTSFGKGNVSNGIGLLMPSVLSFLTKRRVVTYMHNFFETQDVTALGYSPGLLERFAVRVLEKLLVSRTCVFVPLRSQGIKIRQTLGGKVYPLLLPGIEGVWFSLTNRGSLRLNKGEDGTTRVLLFGSWGPQKDLEGALAALKVLTDIDEGARVTIAGEMNPHFPEYRVTFEAVQRRVASGRFKFIGRVEEEFIPTLFTSHDLLILPYKAAGGYSGALNWAVTTGIGVIAYDLPELRECASSMDLNIQFVPAGDAKSLVVAIQNFVHGLHQTTEGKLEDRQAMLRIQLDAAVGVIAASLRQGAQVHNVRHEGAETSQ